MEATIADVETILGMRTRGLLQLVGMSEDYSVDPSPRAYMADPIGYSVRKCEGTTASFLAPNDSDLATVVADKADQLLDIAELRLIDNALGWWTKANQSRGPLNQALGALGEFYLKRAECLREKVKDVYQVDAPVAVVGGDGMGGFSNGVPSTEGFLSGI